LDGTELRPSESMTESRWPLVLLLAMLWAVGLLILIGLMLLVHVSPLPDWLKGPLNLVLIGFVIPGANSTRRRVRGDKNPWSKQTERG
jgi:hypothetical protein